jgi:ferredoxin
MGKKSLIQPSTRALIREARQVKGFTFFDLLHSYIYGRWTYFYIAMGTGMHPLAKRLSPLLNWIGSLIVSSASKNGQAAAGIEDTYHGKVLPLPAARQLVSVKQPIALGDLENVVPYSLARELILKNPTAIVALDCPCRSARQHPCLPLDVCLIVGEPFASFTVEHHPTRSRWISPEQAEQVLYEEDRRGHVHHAFFKDAMLGRFYAICNCCACCCGAMQAQRSGVPMLASSGYVAAVDGERCTRCRKCEKACQFSAITVGEQQAVVDLEKCMGCGVCVGQCKKEAIQLVRMESKGAPLEIQALMDAFVKEQELASM